MNVKIGDKAKDFTLKDQDGKELHLSDLKGKKVLLSFHPLAWTSVCAEQMQSLEKARSRFEKLNTVAFGISVDTVPSKKAWGKRAGHQEYQATFRFLAAWRGCTIIRHIQGKGWLL